MKLISWLLKKVGGNDSFTRSSWQSLCGEGPEGKGRAGRAALRRKVPPREKAGAKALGQVCAGFSGGARRQIKECGWRGLNHRPDCVEPRGLWQDSGCS